jgi:anti-anti-sigma factor
VISRPQIINGVCFFVLEGEFDHSNVDELRAAIDDCLEQAPSLVLDFGGVSYANGALLSLLIDTVEHVGPLGWVGVVRPLPEIERLFHVSGLSERSNFYVFPTLTDALNVAGEG